LGIHDLTSFDEAVVEKAALDYLREFGLVHPNTGARGAAQRGRAGLRWGHAQQEYARIALARRWFQAQ